MSISDNMEKFLVNGYSNFHKKKCQLILPKAKHYEDLNVSKEEDKFEIEDIILHAIKRKKCESYHIPVRIFSKDPKVIEEILLPIHQILSKHPYPLSQGPVLLPIDCATEEKKSINEVLTAKTVFAHSDSQRCYEWTPASAGTSTWGTLDNSYEVSDLNFCVQGPASLKNMAIVYTCNLHKCVIHCPCTVCRDPNINCKMQCRTEVCQQCNSQCTNHVIKLPRLFNIETDKFTMVTQRIHKYQFAYSYAGIPVSCDACSQDVLEHQVLHLVFHTRCRFCRFEMRPFEQKSITSIEEYKQAEKILNNIDSRTCSVCLLKSQDKYARVKHEESVHEGKEKQYKCNICDKSYSNINALNYHKANHENIKSSCDLCGFQCSSDNNLLKHKQFLHGEASKQPQFSCLNCGINFSRKSHFDRHNREQHYDTNVNLDFVEDMDSLKVVKCEECNQTFSRKENMQQHYLRNHSEAKKKTFDCSICEKQFSTRYTLNRHVKSKH